MGIYVNSWLCVTQFYNRHRDRGYLNATGVVDMFDKESLNMIAGAIFLVIISSVTVCFGFFAYASMTPYITHVDFPTIPEPAPLPTPPKDIEEPIVIPTLDSSYYTPGITNATFNYIVVGGGGGGASSYNTTGATFYINSTGGGTGHVQPNYYQWG